MQDRYRHLDEKPLATHGRTIHWVKLRRTGCEQRQTLTPTLQERNSLVSTRKERGEGEVIDRPRLNLNASRFKFTGC